MPKTVLSFVLSRHRDLPSTFRGIHGTITYNLTVTISRPWHLSKSFVTELMFRSRVNLDDPQLWVRDPGFFGTRCVGFLKNSGHYVSWHEDMYAQTVSGKCSSYKANVVVWALSFLHFNIVLFYFILLSVYNCSVLSAVSSLRIELYNSVLPVVCFGPHHLDRHCREKSLCPRYSFHLFFHLPVSKLI